MKKNTTETRLKTMTKHGNSHFFRKLTRIFKYGFIGFGRNIWLSITSTLVMTFTLVILFVTVIASIMLNNTAAAMREKIDITIFFKPGTSQTTLDKMATTMSSDPNVKSVEVATSEDEYAEFIEETKKDGNEELLTTLDDKEMKALMIKSMQATMRIKVVSAEDLTSIKNIVATDPDFAENLDPEKTPTYNTNDTAINTITSWAEIAKNGGLGLSALFLVISILVIFNTIRMAIFSRSEEIYMEKLVGADNHFVRGPFLVEAMICGVLAGVLGALIGTGIFNLASPNLANYDIDVSAITNIINSSKLILIYLTMIGTGALIGLISSRLAVHKYLH